MEKQFSKLREYLKMDTEIPFAEFSAYYKEVLAELMANYQAYDRAALLRAAAITTVAAANALDRAGTKNQNTKKIQENGRKALVLGRSYRAASGN